MSPKGRGANKPSRGTGRGTQSGRLKTDSMETISSRRKYAPTKLEDVLSETDTFLDKLRKRFRRKGK